MATVQSPKYVPLMPDLTSTFSTAPDIIPSAAPRCAVNAFASKVLVCRAAVLPWLASVIFGIPAFVLLIVGDQRRRYYGAHLAGFPLTFIAISLLADTFTAAYHAAKNVFRVEWREPAWRDHAETIHHLSMLCAGWQFHVFEAVMIVFGAFLVICETYLNGELTAGVVLSFLLSTVHMIYAIAPLHRSRFIYEVRAEGGEYLRLVPVQETEPLEPGYQDIERSTAAAATTPESTESTEPGS